MPDLNMQGHALIGNLGTPRRCAAPPNGSKVATLGSGWRRAIVERTRAVEKQ